MSKPIHRQLLEAYEEAGLTWDELIRLANLKCSADSISRKLRGKQSLRSGEIERLARALRIQVTAGAA
jgi:hypothetical protein